MPVDKGEDRLLIARAEGLGIQTSYRNDAGKVQRISIAALHRIMEALGDASARQESGMQPVYVFWDAKPHKLQFPIAPGTKESDLHVEMRAEQGKPFDVYCQFRIVTVKGSRRAELAFSQRLPLGYYYLTVTSPAGGAEALVICAPAKCFGSTGIARQWGLFAPMYAVHSQSSWGGGSSTDFANFGRWAAEAGADFVGTLPLSATFLSKPFEPSPYSPASRLFWSEYFIDVARIPELAESKTARALINSSSFQQAVQKTRSSEFVNYAEEMQAKRRVLEQLAEFFFSRTGERRAAFDAFLRKRPDVGSYARFRAAGEKYQSSWHTWPERAKAGDLTPSDYRDRDVRYHLYAQFIAQEQMDALLETYAESGISLYLDLPVGVNSDSFDVWQNQKQFVRGVSCGAPPDVFFSKGQDWGFPPLHPQALRNSKYDHWRKVIRFQLKHAKILRLDHIMGLHRLYWVPHGLSAKDGAYVRYNAEELYAILALESHLNESVLIGENLGTVPEAVNKSMRQHGVRGMYILQFEHRNKQPAVTPPKRDVLATFDTHDTPTFGAFVRGEDLALRQKLGLLKPSVIPAETKQRRALLNAYIRFLRKQRLLASSKPESEDILRASVKYLGRSPADFVLIPLEDLWLESNAQNVPGTTDQHPNWKRKTKFTLEQIAESSEIRELLHELSNARHPVTNKTRRRPK